MSGDRELFLNPTLHVQVTFTVAVRGGIRRKQAVEVDDELASALLALQRGGDEVELELDEETMQRLREAHVLVERQDAPTFVRFRADASPELASLRPVHGVQTLEHDADDAIVDGVVTQAGVDRPEGLAADADLPPSADARRPVLWVPDARTGFVRPRWPSDLAVAALEQAKPSGEIPPAAREELRELGALDSPARREAERAAFASELEEARLRLEKEGYAILRGLLSPLERAAWRRYCRELHREGFFEEEATQFRGRLAIYQESLARSLHPQLNGLVRHVTGEALQPSFCYLAVYPKGSQLKKHRDREQCVWNLSLVLDAAPERPTDGMWPIYLECNGQPVRVSLGIGDAVLYRGTDVPHWRDPLAEQDYVTACFYHFVPTSFTGYIG
jgi:hypothetical protein